MFACVKRARFGVFTRHGGPKLQRPRSCRTHTLAQTLSRSTFLMLNSSRFWFPSEYERRVSMVVTLAWLLKLVQWYRSPLPSACRAARHWLSCRYRRAKWDLLLVKSTSSPSSKWKLTPDSGAVRDNKCSFLSCHSRTSRPRNTDFMTVWPLDRLSSDLV